ncbi:DUF6597 domain-containing transcriptional factor [Pedobacter sp. NJ-S-72]
MIYTELPVHQSLTGYIDAYWTIRHVGCGSKEQRILPDGCIDIIFNLGAECTTSHGRFLMEPEKAYLIGTMTTFTTSCIPCDASLVGVRFKPAAFSNFFFYDLMRSLTLRWNCAILFARAWINYLMVLLLTLIIFLQENYPGKRIALQA